MRRSTSVHLRKIKRSAPNGRARYEWHLRWHETSGKHLCRKIGDCATMTKREAEKRRRELQVEMDRGEQPRDAPSKMTLDEFRRYYEEVMEGKIRASTLDLHLLDLRHLKNALRADTLVDSITVRDLGELYRYLRERGVADATVAKTISGLRSIFNYALRWEMVTRNPFAGEKLPRTKSRQKRIFSEDEIRAMITVAPTEWWKMFIRLAATTGMRRNELLHLCWGDIDEGRSSVRVSTKRSGAFNVGNESFPVLEFSPKSHHERVIPIPSSVVNALREYRKTSDGSRYLFLSLARLRQIASRPRRRRFEAMNNGGRDFAVIQEHAAKHLGISDWQIGCVHDLRRTYGTHMADVVPMHVLKVWMGHEDIQTTADFYLGVTDQHAERVEGAWTL